MTLDLNHLQALAEKARGAFYVEPEVVLHLIREAREAERLRARIERYEALLRKQEANCAVQIDTDGDCLFCQEIRDALTGEG